MHIHPSVSFFLRSHFKRVIGSILSASLIVWVFYEVAFAGIWGTPVEVLSATIEYTSLEVVNGNPGISYYNVATGDLHFVRALDEEGTTWGAPISLDGPNIVGQYTSLAIVNGNPAISYHGITNSNLKYVRATDANGTTWGAPIIVDLPDVVGLHSSLEVVNGNPAISYYDASNGDLNYIRANDVNGDSWPSAPIIVDGGTLGMVVGEYTSLAVINGNPAISYYDAIMGDLKFIRALDANGNSWGTPVTLDATDFVGQYTSLTTVNGNPAIAYYDVTNGALKYVRAADANGTAWDTPLVLDNSADVGRYASLLVVSGHPAVSYYDATNGDLKYVRADDTSGFVWGFPGILDEFDGGDYGKYSSMAIVDGNPAVSYQGSLRFVRSLTPTALTLTSFDAQPLSLPGLIVVPLLTVFGILVWTFCKSLFAQRDN